MSRANRLRSTTATFITATALFLVSGCGGRPSATPASASPETSGPPQATPTVSAVASTAPIAYEDIEPGTGLAAGTYVLRYASIGGAQRFPTLAITFTVPDGWDRVLIDGAVWGDGMRVVFAVVDNLCVDPCEPNLGLRDPAVGPSVDDLATALGTVPGWEIIEADHDLYFGYPAVRLVLSGPTSTGTEQVIPAAPIPSGTSLSDYNMGGGSGLWQPHEARWAPDGETLVFVGTDGIWGTAILLTAPATGEEVPTAMSDTWVTEWGPDIPPSWQVDAP